MVGCASEGAGPTETDGRAGSDTPPASLFGTTWFVQEIDANGVIDGVGPMLVLRTAGHVAGSGGCNSFSGPVTINGDAITFGAARRR
jgi:putative lipoprotein